ncbi:MAG TPA: hypothetical protein VKU37_01260 [Verrucomicrobiae bacterium]|nr:hypothetical protein [Verrucomicrobiae bacterium]
MKTSKNPRHILEIPVITQCGKFIARFITAACAAVMVCFALNSQATNLLTNPGFEASPIFNVGSWVQQTHETWSSGQNTQLSRTPTHNLWMQGPYGNGGSANTVQWVAQTWAAAPGNTYSANAYFSEFVQFWITGGEGGDNQSDTNLNGSCGLFTSDGSGQEDAWVDVLFLDSNSNILSDYKSTILTPAFVDNLTNNPANLSYLVTTNSNTDPYHPGVVTNVYLTWINCQVTNQYSTNGMTYLQNIDPAVAGPSIIGTLAPGQNMVAPPGTAYVQYRIASFQNLYESGAQHWDDCDLELVGGPAASVIGNYSPNGSQFFNISATNFTFTVQSAASGGAPLPTNPANGIQVLVNGQNKSATLQFSGNSTNWNVTLPGLVSNQVYNISISVSNSVGLLSSGSVTFDTFGPNNFIVNVEDYDYTNQYIQNPIPTAAPAAGSYFGLGSNPGSDQATYLLNGVYTEQLPAGSSQNINGLPYRADGNVAFQQATDLQLPLYQAQSNAAVFVINLSYNNPGNWENYTRFYPQGNYIVYARVSSGNGAPGGIGNYETLNVVTGGLGTTNQTTNTLGYFIIPNGTDWGHYYWVPLTDQYGNVFPVSVPSGQQTLKLASGGGLNVIDFMFVPLSAAGFPPIINNFNPPILSGQNVFVSGTSVSFSASSLTSTIATNNVHTYINGIPVPETFTGTGTNWNVTFPIPVPNQIENFAISVVDNNGLSNGVAGTFDTFSQNNLMIEAGDFDFNGGQWIDNPIETATTSAATNSYFGYPGNDLANAAVYGVDFTTTNVTTAETYLYRFDGNGPGGFTAAGTEVTSDFLRSKLINMGPSAVPPFEYVPGEAVPTTNSDFDVGWWPPGTWLNYTRTIPTNTYVIYGRLAAGAPYSGATLGLVTLGRTTTSQTTQLLGTFSDANANGFQSWHWVPLMTNGQMAVITLGGVQTLKVTAPPGSPTGSMNSHFYMLVPYSAINSFSISALVSAGTVSIKFPTQNGHSYTVLYSTSLNPASWQTLSSGINGDGTVKTVTDSTSGGAQRFYRVAAQ